MSQCVPTWNSDQHPSMTNVPSSLHHLFSGSVSENLKSNNEVAELRWKNGKPQLGTLESIIDQATAGNSGEAHQPSFVSWLTGVDATVHCSDVPNLASRAGSCSGDGEVRERKRARRWSCVNEEEEEEEEEEDMYDLYGTTSSPEGVWEEGGGSPETENTSSGDHEYSLSQNRRSLRVGRVRADQEKEKKKKMKKKKVMGRSRAADIHNQSERKRRDRINQKMTTLQKLVPNSTKTDKASILDEVIDYLKQLQNQVKSMSSFHQMMMPLAMPHLQMAHMAQMAQMAQMGLGHGFMDLGFFGRPGAMATPLPPLHHPPAFMPFVAAGERMPTTGDNSVSSDAFSTFSQQSMNMDAYNKMVAMYQQLHQQPPKPNI